MDEIEIVPYDPKWPTLFEIEAATLHRVLPSELVITIEHFGSTAVPKLSAKPIIDVLIVVPSISVAREQLVPAIEAIGYAFWYDNPDTEHLFFVKGLPPNGPRTHHIHMVTPDKLDERSQGCLFTDRLMFRDYLRTHPDEAQRYAEIKHKLSTVFHNDREAYTDAKTDYVESVLHRAKINRS